MVEPAFVILRRTDSQQLKRQNTITVVTANESFEGDALRTLRKGRNASSPSEYHIRFNIQTPREADGWMPRNYDYNHLIGALSGTPLVGELFDVRQGVLTGNNSTFVLADSDLTRLGPSERKYFRPAAGTSTIRNGTIICSEWVFYPYLRDGSTSIQSERELESELPTYYREWLLPNREQLQGRRGKSDLWWTLTEYRAWQPSFMPKIVTAYFGAAGNFAYDAEGDSVCLHGYAWFWKGRETELVDLDGDGVDEIVLDFAATQAPFAYVALLNSHPFEILLSCYCDRVQGGQFNLSKRFVTNVPIPDFMGGHVPVDVIIELAEAGRKIAMGERGVNRSDLAKLVSQAYSVPIEAWRI